ncbi:MAG TPA: hypothetical protein VIR33_09070 [Thermopolyspora sp.]|jgi:hypothetical protein
MSFIQVIEYDTTRADEIQRLMDEWREGTEGRRTATHAILARDRSKPDHYVEVVEFPSYEDAKANSELPQTDTLARRMAALCEGSTRFVDLEVIREEDL